MDQTQEIENLKARLRELEKAADEREPVAQYRVRLQLDDEFLVRATSPQGAYQAALDIVGREPDDFITASEARLENGNDISTTRGGMIVHEE